MSEDGIVSVSASQSHFKRNSWFLSLFARKKKNSPFLYLISLLFLFLFSVQMADWTQLDDLVQVSYSVTDAAIIYSRYTNHTWQLHVFRESEAYAVSFEGTTELEKVMVRLENKVAQPCPSLRSKEKRQNANLRRAMHHRSSNGSWTVWSRDFYMCLSKAINARYTCQSLWSRRLFFPYTRERRFNEWICWRVQCLIASYQWDKSLIWIWA